MELRYVRTEAIGRDEKTRTLHLVSTLLDAEAESSVIRRFIAWRIPAPA